MEATKIAKVVIQIKPHHFREVHRGARLARLQWWYRRGFRSALNALMIAVAGSRSTPGFPFLTRRSSARNTFRTSDHAQDNIPVCGGEQWRFYIELHPGRETPPPPPPPQKKKILHKQLYYYNNISEKRSVIIGNIIIIIFNIS